MTTSLRTALALRRETGRSPANTSMGLLLCREPHRSSSFHVQFDNALARGTLSECDGPQPSHDTSHTGSPEPRNREAPMTP